MKEAIKLVANYLSVLKPRESILLTFIGVCAAIVGAEGYPSISPFLFALVAIGLGSSGCNALTNYLDRKIDARMKRTCRRALPSKRIYPPEKILPLAAALVATALVLAWKLHPLCFLFGSIGVFAALTWRKRVTCVFPQGALAGCAPVLVGYLAFSPHPNWTILFICLLIMIWIPLHVWSVMLANREDYIQAGITYFPLNLKVKEAVKVLFLLSFLLYSTSIMLWWVADFGWLYFVTANLMGIATLYASANLMRTQASKDAWKIYKLSAFPYLGLIFLAMCLNFWL